MLVCVWGGVVVVRLFLVAGRAEQTAAGALCAVVQCRVRVCIRSPAPAARVQTHLLSGLGVGARDDLGNLLGDGGLAGPVHLRGEKKIASEQELGTRNSLENRARSKEAKKSSCH